MHRSTIFPSLFVTAALVLSGASPIQTLNSSDPVKITALATAQASVEIAADKPPTKSPKCPDKKDNKDDKDKGGDDHDCKAS
jgi:hypothetical protein